MITTERYLIMPHDRFLYPYWRGKFNRSTKREASDLDPQHPMKQEMTRFIMFYVPVALMYF
jgi:hypothetical protein